MFKTRVHHVITGLIIIIMWLLRPSWQQLIPSPYKNAPYSIMGLLFCLVVLLCAIRWREAASIVGLSICGVLVALTTLEESCSVDRLLIVGASIIFYRNVPNSRISEVGWSVVAVAILAELIEIFGPGVFHG